MDLEERAKLNLTVLKRHDPSVVDICDQSPHAVVYKFVRDKNGWDKMGVEGVLFLVHRQTSPEYALCILNRLSMDNFWLYLSDIMDISLNEEFVMCQTSEGNACGLWLFEEKDRQRFVDRILQLRKTGEGQVDIMKLFEKATIAPQPPPKQPETAQQQHASELLRLLQPNKASDEQPQQPPPYSQAPPMMFGGPPPPPPPPQPYHHPMEDMTAAAAAHINDYSMMHPSSPMRPPPPPPPPPSHFHQHQQPSSAPMENEPTQSFIPAPSLYPNAAAASPQKAASLLQALQGGTSHIGSGAPAPAPSTSSTRNPPPHAMGWPGRGGGGGGAFTSPLSSAPPLLHQQAMDLAHSELDRRMHGTEAQPPLSKPEFIQQFLNMVQNDASFLDTLYDRYRHSRQSNGSKSGPLNPMIIQPLQ